MKFPDKLYVRAEHDGEDHFFVADQDLENHAQIGEKIKVGVYQLVEVAVLTVVMELVKKP